MENKTIKIKTKTLLQWFVVVGGIIIISIRDIYVGIAAVGVLIFLGLIRLFVED